MYNCSVKRPILVVGSINMDLVVEVQRLPQKGETVFGETIRYVPGGKGANQAVAASRLEADVGLVGKVGRDHFGAELKKFLKRENLNLDGVATSSLPSGLAVITVDGKGGDNTIVVLKGANSEVNEEYIEKHRKLIKAANIVSSTYETPQKSVEKLFSIAKGLNKTTMLNTSPAIATPENLWEKIDYLVLNEKELSFYAGAKKRLEDIDKMIQAAKKLITKGVTTVVVTVGALGAVTVTKKKIIRTEGLKVNAVDTTGAGDCFMAALATQINDGTSLEEALDFANRAAAISVQRWGAGSSLPYLYEIES